MSVQKWQVAFLEVTKFCHVKRTCSLCPFFIFDNSMFIWKVEYQRQTKAHRKKSSASWFMLQLSIIPKSRNLKLHWGYPIGQQESKNWSQSPITFRHVSKKLDRNIGEYWSSQAWKQVCQCELQIPIQQLNLVNPTR